MDRNRFIIKPCQHGLGVFANVNFHAQDIITTMSGRLITGPAAAALKPDEMANSIQIAESSYLEVGSPYVYFNHSCQPNAGLRPSLELVALKNIKKGDEIFFDYSTTMGDGTWQMECHCQSSQCRKLIIDFWYLSPSLQTEYISLGIVQEFLKISTSRSG